MFLRSVRHSLLLACLLGGSAIVSSAPARAATDAIVRTTQQGVHAWKTASGKLFMVAGTYQDTTAYRRSMSFYFVADGQNEWQQVPIVESRVDLTTAWTSASRGETTLRDAVVVPRGRSIYLVVAERSADKPAIGVARYRFVLDSEDHPDGPSALFVPHSKTAYPVAKLRTVEAVLDKEIGLLPKH